MFPEIKVEEEAGLNVRSARIGFNAANGAVAVRIVVDRVPLLARQAVYVESPRKTPDGRLRLTVYNTDGRGFKKNVDWHATVSLPVERGKIGRALSGRFTLKRTPDGPGAMAHVVYFFEESDLREDDFEWA